MPRGTLLTAGTRSLDSSVMKSELPPGSDSDLRDRILTGVRAVEELELRFRQPLERYLFSLCDRGDGRSQEKAVEIAGQILAECFIKSPSLLERWQGPDNLDGFLRTAARNRLKSWWTSAEKKRTEVNSESLSLANAPSDTPGIDREEIEIAEQAVRAGVAAAVATCPEGMVFMRLKGLHGADQRAISICWGHHEAQTSRRIKEAMDTIRTTAVEKAARKGVELTTDLLRGILQNDPQILLGEAPAGEVEGDYQSLRLLAENGGDAATRRHAVELMCRDPQMLAFFAQALNRRSGREALVVRDSSLSGIGARLTDCIRNSLEILQPSEAVGLIPQTLLDSFADGLEHMAADGGTLWLLCPGSAALEAVCNPLEPEIAGKRQPLASGIVSLVLATGESACVSGVSAHQRHSPVIDIALGKTTRHMIAVPFVLAGPVRGVLTAVRLVSEQPFGNRETAMLERHSEILAAGFICSLTERILG
jgi:DNA-directed RNA polymerase specialized sigma24 family protein